MFQSIILTSSDKSEWSNYLRLLPEFMQDIYYTPEYYEIYEKNGDGKALCFVFRHGDNLALYPFLLNNINKLGYELQEDYYDIQGAYGYNGILSSTDESSFINLFYQEFEKYCKRNNIIAEFTRFHPLLNNCEFSKDYLTIAYNRQTVYVDLTVKYEEIYGNYNRKIRRIINHAKSNINCQVYEGDFPYKEAFIEIYNENMIRVNADEYLYFNNEYFENIFKFLPVVQFVVFYDDKPIATSITFNWKNYLHGHLGASKTEYLSVGAVPFLNDARIRYGIEKGYKILHLGGGRSSSEDDSLLEFKKKFSNKTFDFYIGNRIYNQDIYNILCEQWFIKYPHLVNKHSNKFLRYKFIL